MPKNLTKEEKEFWGIGLRGHFWTGHCPDCKLEIMAYDFRSPQTEVIELIKKHMAFDCLIEP